MRNVLSGSDFKKVVEAIQLAKKMKVDYMKCETMLVNAQEEAFTHDNPQTMFIIKELEENEANFLNIQLFDMGFDVTVSDDKTTDQKRYIVAKPKKEISWKPPSNSFNFDDTSDTNSG